MRQNSVAPLLVFIFCACQGGPTGGLWQARPSIERIASGIDARVGVAAWDLESGDTLTVGGTGRYPMQSVYKFPLALAVLHRVDRGELSLNQKIQVTNSDLLPDTWSPLREKYPGGNVDLPLSEILRYTAGQSDNNGCDILFRLLGGPAAVQTYLRTLGINDIAVVSTEGEMHAQPDLQYQNWSTPLAMAGLLRAFDRGEVLSDSSTAFLRRVLEESPTGPRRIRGLLPPGTVVAHKTGSSGADGRGIIAATNDVGIITLPSGKHVVLAVFVSDASAGEQKCEETIALIARSVWDAVSSRGR